MENTSREEKSLNKQPASNIFSPYPTSVTSPITPTPGPLPSSGAQLQSLSPRHVKQTKWALREPGGELTEINLKLGSLLDGERGRKESTWKRKIITQPTRNNPAGREGSDKTRVGFRSAYWLAAWRGWLDGRLAGFVHPSGVLSASLLTSRWTD